MQRGSKQGNPLCHKHVSGGRLSACRSEESPYRSPRNPKPPQELAHGLKRQLLQAVGAPTEEPSEQQESVASDSEDKAKVMYHRRQRSVPSGGEYLESIEPVEWKETIVAANEFQRI